MQLIWPLQNDLATAAIVTKSGIVRSLELSSCIALSQTDRVVTFFELEMNVRDSLHTRQNQIKCCSPATRRRIGTSMPSLRGPMLQPHGAQTKFPCWGCQRLSKVKTPDFLDGGLRRPRYGGGTSRTPVVLRLGNAHHASKDRRSRELAKMQKVRCKAVLTDGQLPKARLYVLQVRDCEVALRVHRKHVVYYQSSALGKQD